jgi:AraC-like DNA-binding protein
MPDGLVVSKTEPFGIVVEALAGEYRVTHSGVSTVGGPGSILVIPPHTPVVFEHSRGSDPEMRVRFAHLGFLLWNAIDPLTLLDLPRRIQGMDAVVVGRCIDRMLGAGDIAANRISEFAEQLQIGATLLQVLSQHSTSRPAMDDALERTTRLAPLVRFMREHLAEPLGIDRLAREARMSRAGLHRHFGAVFGVPPLRYLKHLRLDEAATLLVRSDTSLAGVASAVGFANQFHFSREFTVRFGRSPSTYRRSPISPQAFGV